ncbi:MAG: ribosome assembly factor SBDS [Candidatus Diapherotrites archaeon]
MVKLEEAVIARFVHEGHKFEVLVDPDLAMDVKKGKAVNSNDLLAIDRVFKDAGKGEDQSEALTLKVFGTVDAGEVAKKIILKGSVQLTTEQRRELREKRRREIIQIIATNAINPQTNAPHPPQRIELALNELNLHIDEFKPAEEQVEGILKELKKKLPISFEKMQVAVKIPAAYAGRTASELHHFEVKKEEWLNDGSLIMLVEIPAGLKNDLFNKANKATHGEAEIRVLDQKERIA